MTATATLSRTFSYEESKAIASIDLSNLPEVLVSFRSNPEKVYTFQSSEDYASDLVEVLADPEMRGRSMGTFIHEGRSTGDLKEVQV